MLLFYIFSFFLIVSYFLVSQRQIAQEEEYKKMMEQIAKKKQEEEEHQRRMQQEQLRRERSRKIGQNFLNLSKYEQYDAIQSLILDVVLPSIYPSWNATREAIKSRILSEMRDCWDIPTNESLVSSAILAFQIDNILELVSDGGHFYYQPGYNCDTKYSEIVLSRIRATKEKERQILSSGIATIDKMEGHEFEQYCATLLRKLNFSNVKVTKGSGDQGVDVIAEKDGKRYAIQCKRYSSTLGNSPIQEVNAGMLFYHCQVAAVMTNQYFTSGAKQLAKVTGVLLWDRDELIRMINQANAST